MITYAVGDIHGRHDLLTALLDRIGEHAEGREHRLVFLGDYIDRGPDSASVLQRLREIQAQTPERVTCLMGNHEDLLLSAVDRPGDRHAALSWIRNGGDTTLASFGVAAAEALPADLIGWLRGLPTSHEDAHRYYVHAGADPARPLDRQRPHDLLWIREPFLEVDHDFGKHVVHGHTPVRTGVPDQRAYRTNLDTAAVWGGPLTAGVFIDGAAHAVEFLSAR